MACLNDKILQYKLIAKKEKQIKNLVKKSAVLNWTSSYLYSSKCNKNSNNNYLLGTGH